MAAIVQTIAALALDNVMALQTAESRWRRLLLRRFSVTLRVLL